ncbi:MAG: hypothetical protein ACFFFY_07825 [Promethearchaeota archaeon]
MSFYILINKSNVNKKIKVCILFYVLFVIILLTNSVKGFSCNNTSLITDKNVYYNHEKVKINASWELYYDSEYESSFIRIQIIDSFDNVLWNSSKYYSVGMIEKNWTVNIQILNITYSNFSNILFIKMYNHYELHGSPGGLVVDTFKESLTIKIFKRGINCELVGFKNNLIFGETNYFKATFSSIEPISPLINETFRLITSNNNQILFQTNLTTNDNGEITFNLSSISHLNLGRNKVVFTMNNNILYNDTTFSYEIFVSKIPIFVNITNFEDNIEEANIINIQLFYYYFFNQSKKPIENADIKIILYANTTSEYELDLKTDQFGFVNINISPYNIIFQAGVKLIYVDVIFNGTEQLENKTIAFNLRIQNFLYQGISNLFYFTNISLFSVLFVLLSIITLKSYNLQKNRFKLIRELTFKF